MGTLQQAWQWLVPPVVADSEGRLLPRGRARSVAPIAQPLPPVPRPEAEPAAAELPRHPQANQQTLLGGRTVHYLLRHSSRRSIGFSIGAEGLVVTAPGWVGLREAHAALLSKADWIVRKLEQAGQRQALQAAARVQWADGGVLDYAGRAMRLSLTPGTAQAHREVDAAGGQLLCLPLAREAPAAQVRAAVQAWMLRQARPHFTARLLHFAPLLEVQWNALRLTSARTRWGSANTGGVIRLNWRLMQHAPAVIDYVVVHELAHLRHMDHSPRFWGVVESVLPEWKQLRQILKDKPLPAWE